jgi:zinc transporter 2
LVDDTESDVESDAGQTTTASERDPLTGRRRRRSSETSAFYKCDDRGRPIASSPETRSAKRRLYIACFLAVAFFFLELAAGIISGSLALLSDSFHLLSDVAGFIISLVAIHLAEMPATSTYSYGFHRVEILGAILSTSLIWALTAGLVWEAIQRVQNPAVVDGKMMAITAGIGVGVNILLAVVLGGHGHSHGPGGHGHDHGHDHGGKKTVESPVTYGALEEGHGGHSHDEGSGHDHEHDHDHEEPSNGAHDHDFSHEKKWSENINVSSAAIHVIGDIVSSVGVLIAGIVVYFYPEWTVSLTRAFCPSSRA